MFARFLKSGLAWPVYEVLPSASTEDVDALERQLGVPLPSSYNAFLRISWGVHIQGGGLNMFEVHPFFYEFRPFDEVTPRQQKKVKRCPPPSEGMLCFAEFLLEGDGDQALLHVSRGLQNGEYPVFYYNHEAPSVGKVADSFMDFVESIVVGG